MITARRVLSLVALFGVLAATAGAAYAENAAAPTYYKDVLPILQNNCQTCHRPAGFNISGLVAPMSLMTYAETRPWARAIARKVEAREMPPWFSSAPKGVFANERGLTDQQIRTIVTWVNAGAPAGNTADAPLPLTFAEEQHGGWSHGTPDLIVKMPEPYFVKDDVFDLNMTFSTPLTEQILPEDVWVRGWEFRTGADGRGVHHMCASVQPGNEEPGPDAGQEIVSGLLSCAAEGAETGMLPDGFGVRLKKGDVLRFSMHFNKEPGPGTGFSDQAAVGFFIERRPVKYEVKTSVLGNNGFEIPPNVKHHRIGMARTFDKDILLLNLWPHAHLRASAARYSAKYPDGREELLLDVPKYDQGWQVTYKYREPKLIPKGTRIDGSFWYDNTAQRGGRRGFEAQRTVGFGPRTNDEMSLLFFAYVELVEAAKTTTDQQN